MATLDAPTSRPSAPSTPSYPAVAGNRVLISGVSWDTYDRIRTDTDHAGDRIRLTYDAGLLELEMPSHLHEILLGITSQLLQQYLLHMGIDYSSAGSTTWKRQAEEKGLEADDCYYIQNVAAVIGKIEINLDQSPPPDLAIEAEVTRPLLPKLPVYAAIGVPEIWHVRDDERVEFLRLTDKGYIPIERSSAVPFFTPSLLLTYFPLRLSGTTSATLQHFRENVLSRLQP